LVIAGVFACGIVAGVFLTLVLADFYIVDPRPQGAELAQQSASAQGVKARAGQKEVTLGLGRKKSVGLESLPPGSLAGIEADTGTPQPELKRGTLSREEVWIETISEVPGPRIYIIHNLLSKSEREHIKSLGTKAGLEKALIIPYGGKSFGSGPGVEGSVVRSPASLEERFIIELRTHAAEHNTNPPGPLKATFFDIWFQAAKR
jgi:hypothetical protein